MSSLFHRRQRAVNDVVMSVAAIAIVLSALIWVAPSGLVLPLLMVVTAILLRCSPRRRTVGTYVLCAGVGFTILTAIFAYGSNGHTDSKIGPAQTGVRR
jgi:hypothetical protein